MNIVNNSLHHLFLCLFLKDALNWAAMNGHLDTVEWLHSNRNEGATYMALNGAAKNGHLKTVEWLHKNR